MTPGMIARCVSSTGKRHHVKLKTEILTDSVFLLFWFSASHNISIVIYLHPGLLFSAPPKRFQTSRTFLSSEQLFCFGFFSGNVDRAVIVVDFVSHETHNCISARSNLQLNFQSSSCRPFLPFSSRLGRIFLVSRRPPGCCQCKHGIRSEFPTKADENVNPSDKRLHT